MESKILRSSVNKLSCKAFKYPLPCFTLWISSSQILRLNKNDYLNCNQSKASITLCQNGLLTHMYFYLTFTFAFFFPFFLSLFIYSILLFKQLPTLFSLFEELNYYGFKTSLESYTSYCSYFVSPYSYLDMQQILNQKIVAMSPRLHLLVLDTMLLITKRN